MKTTKLIRVTGEERELHEWEAINGAFDLEFEEIQPPDKEELFENCNAIIDETKEPHQRFVDLEDVMDIINEMWEGGSQ